MNYEIFISYKRKSLPVANNLYYRLPQGEDSTFFDLEEMRWDKSNIQLLNYVENSKGVFVLLEEGALDACVQDKSRSCTSLRHSHGERGPACP